MSSVLNSSYRMNDLLKFFNARRNAYSTDPKLIDEVIYTPYRYDPSPPQSAHTHAHTQPPATTGDLLGIPELHPHSGTANGNGEGAEWTGATRKKKRSNFDTTAAEAEIFMFEYGTVVIWGMTEAQERRFLTSMSVLSWLLRASGSYTNTRQKAI